MLYALLNNYNYNYNAHLDPADNNNSKYMSYLLIVVDTASDTLRLITFKALMLSVCNFVIPEQGISFLVSLLF